MIRLNDIDRTVIDESKVAAYYVYEEDKACIYLGGTKYVDYNSKEARDKDIELLDKIFDVKSIEDKANEEKPSYDFGELQVMNPKPVKEEYLTWDYVAEYNIPLKAKLPNGDIRTLRYEDNFDGLIGICTRDDNENYSAYFYDKETFNSLKLRKVE
jgi:hypothetical protein